MKDDTNAFRPARRGSDVLNQIKSSQSDLISFYTILHRILSRRDAISSSA